MKIKYDRRIKILGLGVSPWPRLGPEYFFDNYQIGSYYDWDNTSNSAPKVHALQPSGAQIAKLNTASLIKSKDFQHLIEQAAPASVLAYKPLQLNWPAQLTQKGLTLLRPNTAVNYENKVTFRQRFGSELPFAKYKIIEVGESIENLDLPMVFQDESLSGGKGTFIVKSSADLQSIQNKPRTRRLVASEYIQDGFERSLQCCATKYGTFVGPLQKQLIAKPELTAADAGASKFCGGEIDPADSLTGLYEEMSGYARRVGKVLYQDGYRGVFGVDFLISKSGAVVVLEVNQRLTGLTPLHSMLYRADQDIPFSLLHILDQGNFDYEILDKSIPSNPNAGSLMLLHSPNTQTGVLRQGLRSGTYSNQGQFKKAEYELETVAAEDNLVQAHLPQGANVKPNTKLAAIFAKRTVLNSKDELSEEANQFITKLKTTLMID